LEVDAKESTRLKSIPTDKIVFDEMDVMERDATRKALERMGASTVREEAYLSNPVLPSSGIAAVYEDSDQRHWWRACPKCGQQPPKGSDWEWFSDTINGWTSAEVSFPEQVCLDDSGKGYIACRRCGGKLGLAPGLWVPKRPEKSGEMWGYRWSQLTSPTHDPYHDVLAAYDDPPDGNRGDVVRLKLGLPFVSAEDKLTVAQVLSCCGGQPQLNGHEGPCAMGVDVRKHKNVIIGVRSGRDRYQILRVARLENWDDILQMANRFHVKSCVVDIRPYEDAAREFQKKARFKTWLCEYSETTPVGTIYNERTGIVKPNRTEILDATHRLIASERQLELPSVCPEVKQFARECASIAKVKEINKRTQQGIFRYRKLGTTPDDYRHALVYFYLAASGGKVGVVGDKMRPQRPSHAFNDYCRW
jgi:hypothetical protein